MSRPRTTSSCRWWPLLLVCGWLLSCGRTIPDGVPPGEAVLVVEVDLDIDGERGTVAVHEGYVWQASHGPASRTLKVDWVEGAFPIRPRITEPEATVDDEPVPLRVRHYGDWVSIDPELPAESTEGRHRLDLRYRLVGAWVRQDDIDVLPMQQLDRDTPLSVRNTTLMVSGAGDDPLSVWVAHGYQAYTEVPITRTPHGSWVATLGPSPGEEPLFWKLGVRSSVSRAGGPPYLATLVEQTSPLAWVLLALGGLAIVLRMCPARLVIMGTQAIYVGLCGVVLWEVLGGQFLYWWPEARMPGADRSDAIAEIVGNGGLAVMMVLYLWGLGRSLSERSAEAHELQVALPVILALALPMLWVRTSYLLLPLLALPVFSYWFRRPVALAMGADLHLVVEAVQTHGSVPLDDLARELGLRPRALATLLHDHGDLPLVFDRAAGRVLSASVAALRDDLRVCPSCGGATEIMGQDRLTCPYCEREYASARVPSPTAPIPLVVRAIARMLEAVGRSTMAWALLITGAFILMSMLDDDFPLLGAVLGGGVFFVLPAHGLRVLLRRLAAGLRAGRGHTALVLGLGLLSPLVLPLLALRRVLGRRVQLHFARFDIARLDARLQQQGQLDLDALARFMQTSWDEALELAVHLCGSGQLDAVFDRGGQRLVSRTRLRTLDAAGTCRQCGGIMGIFDGVVHCHHCGAEAETPSTGILPPEESR